VQTRREHDYECQECGYTVKITVTSNGLVIVGLELQGIAIFVGCLNAYSIWRTLKEMSRLASENIEILKNITDDTELYEYFFKNKPLAVESPTHTKVRCCAEIMANVLEHIFLQRPSLPVVSQAAWMRYVRDHYYYSASHVVRDFVTEHRHWCAEAFLEFVDTAPALIKRAT
jgi:hypothetical protein